MLYSQSVNFQGFESAPGGRLETEQIDKRVSWLDEQRRKDALEVTRLEELLEALNESARQQSQQLRDLAGEVARIPALEARIRQYDETIAKHRSEILQQLDTQEERRIAREKQLESLRTIDQKKVAEEVDELRIKLKALDRIDEALDVRKREELRISRTMDGIETKINQATTASENEQRAVTGIKEAGEKNNQRLNELENRGPSVSKRVDELRSLMESSEDQILKLATRAEVVELGEKELRQSQNLWMEQQAARLAEFERARIAWEKRFAEFEIQSDDLKERIESYEETHRSLRLLRDELNDVVERLNRRIEEVSEIQRLSEDRFKQEWSTFQADIQKRWSSFKLSAEEQWKEHGRKHVSISEQLKQLQAGMDTALSSIEQLDRSSKGRISDLVALVQEWGAELRDGDS